MDSLLNQGSSFELVPTQKRSKGKGKSTGASDVEDENMGEEEGAESDVEVEGLLQKGKLEDATRTIQNTVPLGQKKIGSRDSIGSGKGNLALILRRMGLANMTSLERQTLRKEMLTQVR